MKHLGININHLCWILILIILFGQSLLQELSILSNLSLLLIAIIQIWKLNNDEKSITYSVLLWVIMLLGYSFLRDNPPISAVRFALVIFFVCYAYFWKINYVFFLKILFYISAFFVFSLYCLELIMFSMSVEESLALRESFFLPNRMGDVFFYYIYYKLELKGTALISFVYMLSYIVDVFPPRYRKFFRVFYLLGAILAGNFAYQVAIILFHILLFLFKVYNCPKQMARKLFVILFFMSVLGGYLFSYLSFVFEAKADDSNAIKTEQVILLAHDLDSPSELLLGAGLGNMLKAKGAIRDYDGDSYYEVQTMYVFNQLGLLNFTILLLYNVVLAFRKIKHPGLLLVYIVYFAYAFINPYIWDTNHVVVIVSLICSRKRIAELMKQNNCKINADTTNKMKKQNNWLSAIC